MVHGDQFPIAISGGNLDAVDRGGVFHARSVL
jgi:hypothetical protein